MCNTAVRGYIWLIIARLVVLALTPMSWSLWTLIQAGLRMHPVSHWPLGSELYGLLISQWPFLKAFATLSLIKRQGPHRLKGWQR